MTSLPGILNGLSDIAGDYDALICDVWGVLHNGKTAHSGAVEALRKFRSLRGPVVLLSNAPRPVSVLEEQFRAIGVPVDCYDAIITSGVATREALAERSRDEDLNILHIGPERDRGVFDGLPIHCVGLDQASVVLCTGFLDDETETPEDYRGLLAAAKTRGLVLLCANPDIVVQRGGKLVYCAGAIARLYEEMAGVAIYYGKPHGPIYWMTLDALRRIAGRDLKRPLAVGDGLETDIAGAGGAGIDALFIADGIHGENIPALTSKAMQQFFDAHQVSARAAMRALVW
ncbi:MAG: TIGR01459 family HAD-type hydrolase [Rhizomicrobium sp.]|jgi:HAD superfamily hydrolase (TIGR01459 family)